MRVPLLISVAVSAALLAACSQTAPQAEPKTDEEKALYSMGVILSQNIQAFELTEQELAMVKSGLGDGAKDQAKLKPEEIEAIVPKIRELGEARAKAATEREQKVGAEYLAKAATEAGAEKTASNMVYKAVKEGTGPSPAATDNVKVHYEGKLVSGKVFDSSKERGEPVTFPLDQVIGCWTEGVQKMKVGGTAQLVCPPEIAYGEQGRPPSIPGNATLIFDVELLEIVKEDPAAAAAPAP
jgi:FKBP-type peptidyl-prolyl cis-trans isomerase FkpA